MIPQRTEFIEHLREIREYDWLTILDLIFLIREYSDIQEARAAFAAAGAAAVELVAEGVLVAGELDDRGDFHPWPSRTAEEAAARVNEGIAEMIRAGRNASPGAPCWFDFANKDRPAPPPNGTE
ncbi:hypothetical protein [Goodfellowiella coeruleoviolacea]|uniref:Uncharacterized protein n=1 Tax=Goodfellowiella coeruleoviolacea TaxID=334858 RepID=A0AAE3GEN3_9PSEU|nr:hypothetical protein [Goodfellowiella coeruleoviolacea]MCP2164743.1 hypothetical protein [Goodfellowiella coeruleoviolacea]